jgi:hypothetical protein
VFALQVGYKMAAHACLIGEMRSHFFPHWIQILWEIHMDRQRIIGTGDLIDSRGHNVPTHCAMQTDTHGTCYIYYGHALKESLRTK